MTPQSPDNSIEELTESSAIPEVEMTETELVPRSLAYYPAPILLSAAIPMEAGEITDEFREGLPSLFELMYRHGGMGLAAPQISVPKRFFLLNPDPAQLPREENEIVFINPIIVSAEGTMTDTEHCLSCPGVSATITRAAKVVISALDRNGKSFEQTLAGYPARAAQHEMDHLEGRLVVHYLTPAEEALQKSALNRLGKYQEMLDHQLGRIAPQKKAAMKPRKQRKRVKKH